MLFNLITLENFYLFLFLFLLNLKTGNGEENDWTDRMSFGFYMSNGFLQLKKEKYIDLTSAFVQKNKYPIHDPACIRYRNNFACI